MREQLKNHPLESLYTVSHQVDVFKYLSDRKDLSNFLLTAHKKIREVFPDEELVIKISSDPEIVEWRKLIIAIHTNLNADEAYDKLKILDNSWWIDASSIAGDDLDIHIEFDEV